MSKGRYDLTSFFAKYKEQGRQGDPFGLATHLDSLDLDSDHDLRVCGIEPQAGKTRAYLGFSLPLFLSPPLLVLSFSQYE